jgi:hypothetical protein
MFTLTRTRLALLIVAVALLVPAVAVASHVFDDVDDGRFFAGPVEWAATNGITTGTTATTFEPDRGVTRGESVTFLKRYHDNIVTPALPERYHALVDATGAAQPGTSPGVSITKVNAGIFEVEFPPDDIRGCVWQATVVLGSQEDFVFVPLEPPSAAVTIGQDFDAPGGPAVGDDVDPDSIRVRTWSLFDGSPLDAPFHLSVEC